MNRSGFTLVELILFIVIVAILAPAAHIAFSGALKGSADPERIMKARFLAEQKMEYFTRSAYKNIPVGTTNYQAMGGNPGYEIKWTVGYVKYSGSPPNLTVTDSDQDRKYKKIIVSVKEPQGFEYRVYTIVTDRT